MIISDIEQRTPEWFAVRLGKLTGSRAGDMMTLLKSGKESAARRDLKYQLVCERLTHASLESEYQSEAMLRGIEKEPEARAAAELLLGAVHEVGFIEHDTLAAGCSPDGIVGDYEGVIEIKAPKSATHFSYWRGGVLPDEHIYQCIHALWLTGARWVEFISFDDRFPPHLQLFRVRHQRDEAEITAYELLVRQFLREVDEAVEQAFGLVPAA